MLSLRLSERWKLRHYRNGARKYCHTTLQVAGPLIRISDQIICRNQLLWQKPRIGLGVIGLVMKQS